MEAAEAEVAEILLGLRELVPAAPESARRRVFLRWGNRRRRSNRRCKSNCTPEEGIGRERLRLSPATPLSFCPSGGDDTPTAAATTKTSQHKQWLEEQNQRIQTLISTKSQLRRSVEEAKRRFQMLKERNSWLKNLQAEAEKKQRQRQQTLLDLFHHQQQQQQRWRRRLALDLNTSAAAEEEAMLAWQRRMLLSAQARKRRMLLQRAKLFSSPSPSSSSPPLKMIRDIF